MVEFNKQRRYIYVIIVLALLVLLQTCNSCVKNNNIKWQENNNKLYIDSISTILSQKDKYIDSLTIIIQKLEYKDSINSINIKLLSDDKDFLKETNNKLQKNLNKTLSNNEFK